MKILAITNMWPSQTKPGSGVFVEQQVKGLIASGLDVQVMFVDRASCGPGAYYKIGPQLRAWIQEFCPDIIHVMYGGVLAHQVAFRYHDVPLLITFHGSDLLGQNLAGFFRKVVSRYGVYCSRRAALKADGIVVVAEHLKAALHPRTDPGKVSVIPCGIDLSRFQPKSHAECQGRLGWAPDSFHVVFASSSGDPVKRAFLAEAGVSELRNQGVPVELHYLSGISNAEVPTWLSAGDALLLTSLHEGSPTVVKEALACALPIVSVPVGDVAERIAGIQGCFLAEPTAADLAAKLDLVRARNRRLECRSQLDGISIATSAAKLHTAYYGAIRRFELRRTGCSWQGHLESAR